MRAGRLGVEWLTKYVPAFLIFKSVFGLFLLTMAMVVTNRDGNCADGWLDHGNV